MKEQLQLAIKDHWDNWAERFGDIIRNELESFRRSAWKKLILENAPQKEKLNYRHWPGALCNSPRRGGAQGDRR